MGELLDFDDCAVFFELLLGIFGGFFGHAFNDGLGSAFNQVFGFLQTQVGESTYRLDDVDLLGASFLEDNGEFRLDFSFLDGGSSSGGTTSGHRHHGHGGSGFDAPFIFQGFGQFNNF